MGVRDRKILLEQVGQYARSLKDLNSDLEHIARALSREAPGASEARQGELDPTPPKPTKVEATPAAAEPSECSEPPETPRSDPAPKPHPRKR